MKPSNLPEKPTDYRTYFLYVVVVFLLGAFISKDADVPRAVLVSVAIAGVSLIFIKSFTSPVFSLLALVAYLPFSKVVVGQFGSTLVGFNLTNILIGIVIAGWLVYSLNKHERIFSGHATNKMIVIFGVLGLISVIRGKSLYANEYDFESYFILFKRWITPIFLYFMSLNMVKNKDTFKKVLFVMAVATAVIALMSIREYGGDSGSMEKSRVGGVFDQPNMLGAFLVYNMFFFLSFFLYYWRKSSYWLLLLPFLICLRGIMVTFSRGAYLAFALGCMMTTFFRSKVLFLLFFILLCAAFMVPGILPEGIHYRLASTFGGQKVISTSVEDIVDASAATRILIWKGAIEMIKVHPFLGFGYGTFQHLIGYFAPQVPYRDAHNTYLIIAAEMGIPSLVVFLIILSMLIYYSRWLLRNSKDNYFRAFAVGMLGGLFGLLAANMFGSRLNSEEISTYFWLLCGLLIRAVIMRKLHQIE